MKIIRLKNKSIKIKGVIIGALILPLLYIIDLLITQDPDHIIFVLNPILGSFGIILWIVQWIPFLLGGWILAIISTIIFFCIIGFLIGLMIGSILEKIKSKKKLYVQT